jgi:hypothetical protein
LYKDKGQGKQGKDNQLSNCSASSQPNQDEIISAHMLLQAICA